MTGFFKRNPEKIFSFFLACYTIAGLFNLHVLPIAWTDEVMNLDPALQWHKTGQYAGFLWPNKGSDSIFLCYPPLIEFFHMATMYVLPFDIYWMRLPFLLIHVGSLYLLFQLLKRVSGGWPWVAVIMSLIFMFDKVVFEISRSMRVEVLEIFLVLALMYLHQKGGRFAIKGILLGLLLTAHLKMWPVVGLWLIMEWIGTATIKQKYIVSLFSILPLMAFFVFIDFRLNDLYIQMFSQAEKHGAASGFGDKIYGNFIGRFWPVYKEQPWMIPLFLWMCVSAGFQLVHSRGKAFAPVIFLGTVLVWMFMMAPHYRYLPPLYVFGFVVLIADPLFQKISRAKIAIPAFLIILPLIMAGFIARHFMAVWQRDERDPYAVQQWLDGELGNERTLVIGNAAAFYLSGEKNIDYGMDMYPQNLHFDQYRNVYFLSEDSTSLELQAAYEAKRRHIPEWMRAFGKGNTYAGLKLYRIKSRDDWEKITGKYAGDYR